MASCLFTLNKPSFNRVEFDTLLAELGNKEKELFNKNNEKLIKKIEKKKK